MAHIEPMDIDDIESAFENKENTIHHNNVLSKTPCTEKGYEELDVSELNMKLRYSITPASSPMSKSYTASCTVQNSEVADGINNCVNENSSLTHSLNSTLTGTDLNKSTKLHPLQVLSNEQLTDTGNALFRRSIASDIDNNITISIDDNIDENLSFRSISSNTSATHSPDANTPTKEYPKDGGSPIMRGLRNVLNIFRSSQSPVPHCDMREQPLDSQSTPPVQVSIPIATSKITRKSPRRDSPRKESLVFNDDLEKELEWKDETTIIFKDEKVPLHKLLLPQSVVSKLQDKWLNKTKDELENTIENMDISYNDTILYEKTTAEASSNNELTVLESDNEFVDCENTYTNIDIDTKYEATPIIEVDKSNNELPYIENNNIIEVNQDFSVNVNSPLESLTSSSLNNVNNENQDEEHLIKSNDELLESDDVNSFKMLENNVSTLLMLCDRPIAQTTLISDSDDDCFITNIKLENEEIDLNLTKDYMHQDRTDDDTDIENISKSCITHINDKIYSVIDTITEKDLTNDKEEPTKGTDSSINTLFDEVNNKFIQLSSTTRNATLEQNHSIIENYNNSVDNVIKSDIEIANEHQKYSGIVTEASITKTKPIENHSEISKECYTNNELHNQECVINKTFTTDDHVSLLSNKGAIKLFKDERDTTYKVNDMKQSINACIDINKVNKVSVKINNETEVRDGDAGVNDHNCHETDGNCTLNFMNINNGITCSQVKINNRQDTFIDKVIHPVFLETAQNKLCENVILNEACLTENDDKYEHSSNSDNNNCKYVDAKKILGSDQNLLDNLPMDVPLPNDKEFDEDGNYLTQINNENVCKDTVTLISEYCVDEMEDKIERIEERITLDEAYNNNPTNFIVAPMDVTAEVKKSDEICMNNNTSVLKIAQIEESELNINGKAHLQSDICNNNNSQQAQMQSFSNVSFISDTDEMSKDTHNNKFDMKHHFKGDINKHKKEDTFSQDNFAKDNNLSATLSVSHQTYNLDKDSVVNLEAPDEIVSLPNSSPFILVSDMEVECLNLYGKTLEEKNYTLSTDVNLSTPQQPTNKQSLSPSSNLNDHPIDFDDINDPFATKTKIRLSPTPEDSKLVFNPIEDAVSKKHILVEKKDYQKSMKKKQNKCNNYIRKSLNTTADIVVNEDLQQKNMKYFDTVDVLNIEPPKPVIIDNIPNKAQSNINNVTETNMNSKSTEIKTNVFSKKSFDYEESKNIFNCVEIINEQVLNKSKSEVPDILSTKLCVKESSEDVLVLPPAVKESEYVYDNDKHIENNSASTHSQNTGQDTTTEDIHTEDEDTVEGPFIEIEDNTQYENLESLVHITESNQLPNQNTLPSALDNENEENGEVFIDAEAFEFLLNQNKSNIIADSGKESLFLKFDPLFAKRVSSDGIIAALKKVQNKQSTPKKIKKFPSIENESIFEQGPSNIESLLEYGNEDSNLQASSKPMMAVSPAMNSRISPRKITPKVNRQSLTFTSPAMAVIDRLLSLSGNMTITDPNLSTASPNRQHNETDIAITQLREMLAEKEIHVHNLRCEAKELQSRLDLMNVQVKKLEDESEKRLNKVNDLNERLLEKTNTNKSMADVVEKYERTIASLISEMQQEKKNNEVEKTMLIKERDEQTAHLTSMEVSFTDLHSKYEKSKQIILSMKANEDTYKKSITEFEENLIKMQKNYELLKQHATSKLNHANQELEKFNRAHEADILKLKALIKRKELHITSLEETLTQKTKANEELTAICDELINKVG